MVVVSDNLELMDCDDAADAGAASVISSQQPVVRCHNALSTLSTGCMQIPESHEIQNSHFPGLEGHVIGLGPGKSWKISQMVAAF